jgi:transitional endoplasmic reticulum ATPase
LAEVVLPELVDLTDGFTGADLKRLVEDAKALVAYDRVAGQPGQSANAYFRAAVETVNTNKRRYAEAEAQASARPMPGSSMFPMGEF